MSTLTPNDVRTIDLRCEGSAASHARKFVRATLGAWGYEAIESDVTLAVSELVTNAVLHAESDPTVTLLDLDGRVRIRVADKRNAVPKVRKPAIDEPGGRGLMLVQAVSVQWGVEPEPPGKAVWLDVAV